MTIIDAGRTLTQPDRIETLYAFIAEDRPGKEGIAGELLDDRWMPFVFSDPELANKLMPIARQLAKESGKKIKLCTFKRLSEAPVLP